MSVTLILITHNKVGENMLQMATETFGSTPLETLVISVAPTDTSDEIMTQLLHFLKQSDCSDGVLILTDIYGSTPSNTACRLLPSQRFEIISGLNLPMLLKIFNYADSPLSQLTLCALQGGRDGIIHCNRDICQPRVKG
ncbi:MAG: PTS fructose transporter subunit IIA [Gammaproteobacteria bacterium]|nr:PTS fructose transporter subunit IIA [Gammaproteobacteria bacterium]